MHVKMGSRTEYVNVSGLRVDGRRPNEVRRIRSQLGIFPAADGSAIVEHGNTKVIASVHGPREAKRRGDVEHNQAFINVEFGMAPFATAERRKRRAGDRKFQEASTALRQSFETVVQTKLYPRSEIDVYIQVLQSDGGAMAAAINAGTLALIDAGVAMKDFVVACSVAYIQRTALLDPNHTEIMGGGPELVVGLLPRADRVTLTTMDSRMPMDAFEVGAASCGSWNWLVPQHMCRCGGRSIVSARASSRLLQPSTELAMAGCRQIYDILRNIVRERISRKAKAREAAGFALANTASAASQPGAGAAASSSSAVAMATT